MLNCDGIKQTESNIDDSTLKIFYIDLSWLTILRAMFSEKHIRIGLLVPEIRTIEGFAE